MAKDLIDYKARMLDAMRGMVARLLSDAAEEGLPGEHHFYVTFLTTAPGVEIPDALRARFPEEMTIVLQHQFWGLEVDERGFAVTLSFNKRPQRLSVPFAAVTTFVDPSVQFGLQLQETSASEAGAAADGARPEPDSLPPSEGPAPAPSGEKVVTLDAFRRK